MARNRVQFQKGLSETRFDELYGSEDRCREAVFRWRWPRGFVCPGCGRQKHCVIKTRNLYQCTSCRRQTSLIAGTIFASTKAPLRTWFRAMYHLTQSKGGISSLALGRRLGVTQNTAWKLKHKLMQVMRERDAGKRLTGRVEIDDAYLGGERLRWQTRPRRARQDAGHCRHGDHARGPAGAPEAAPGQRLPAQGGGKAGPAQPRIPPAPSSAMASLASAVSPMRDARISRSAPAPAARRCGHPPSSGSTPRSATSRPPSPPPTGPSARNTSLATWPNSPTASIGATISPP